MAFMGLMGRVNPHSLMQRTNAVGMGDMRGRRMMPRQQPTSLNHAMGSMPTAAQTSNGAPLGIDNNALVGLGASMMADAQPQMDAQAMPMLDPYRFRGMGQASDIDMQAMMRPRGMMQQRGMGALSDFEMNQLVKRRF
jgi:hypothetical protein